MEQTAEHYLQSKPKRGKRKDTEQDEGREAETITEEEYRKQGQEQADGEIWKK